MADKLFDLPPVRKPCEERMEEIVRIVHAQPGLTIRMIAHKLGLKKTPYVREMLIELVARDAIHYSWQFMTNGLRCMVFYPNITPVNFDPEVEDDEGYTSLRGNSFEEWGEDIDPVDDNETEWHQHYIVEDLPLSEDPRPEDFLPF